jgi:hypothetical protein
MFFHIVEKASLARPNPGNWAINGCAMFGETIKRPYTGGHLIG